MALSVLQQERIKFHLDFQRGQTDMLKLSYQVDLSILDATVERIVVGTLANATSDEQVTLDGEAICTTESILGRVEAAFANLTAATTNNTMFVKQAGSVTLNPAEANKRKKFYEDKVKELEKALGYAEGLANSYHKGARL